MVWYPGKNVIGGIHNVLERRRDKQALQQRAMGPSGPAPTNAVAGGYGMDRGAQMEALDMARQGAMGQGPSLAEMQAREGAAQAVTDQMGLASMGRGGSMAATGRQAAAMGAAGQMAANRDAAQLRLAEQQAQQAAFMNQANTMAGMSAGAMGQNADIATQWGLGQRGLDAQVLSDMQGNRRGWGTGLVGAGLGAAQGIAMFSDENLKTDIRPAEDDVGDALSTLEPIGYRYKDKRHGPTDKETLGIRAQDLQRTEAGSRAVLDTPEGLGIDLGGSLGLLLAGAGSHEKRLRKLEGRE